MPLDPNLKALLREQVKWEQMTSDDRYGDEVFAEGEMIPCRIEQGIAAVRNADGSVFVPQHILYFDAADERVQAFGLRDRFTVSGSLNDQPLQPSTINPLYGPAGDQWSVEVTL